LAEEEVEILSVPNITAQQIIESTMAIPAFVPATVCTGYITAWFTNLHNFRQRSLIERIFWSLPLSFAVSTIAAFLIGRFISLTAVVVFLLASTAVCVATLVGEARQIRRSNGEWNLGWNPLGGKALVLAIFWIAASVLSLVDIQSDQKLFMNVAMLDQGARANWTESVVHSGIPPTNPLYMDKHPAVMRNYFFWYVVCAAIVRITHFPARVVLTASSAWAGLALMALNGLYLKHFLGAKARLREQFLNSIFLLAVTGLDICAVFWNLFYLHIRPQAEIDLWSTDPVFSWLNTLLWSPNHIAGLICCMFAFLLAWMAGKDGKCSRVTSAALIAAALASAFGLSVYVTFAFFLVMVLWALWQVVIERTPQAACMLAIGGAGAAVLLIPYLGELAHASSGIYSAPFAFAVREMIPPGDLLASHFFRGLAAVHPLEALNLAKLVLLAPGYALEFGFYFVIFLICITPAWRGRTPFTPAQRSLVFIAATTLPFITLIRSGVLRTNDFGWRGALLIQFSMLLLASEMVTSWRLAHNTPSGPAARAGLPSATPQWLRSIAALALVLGIMGTLFQGLMLRFVTVVAEWHSSAPLDSKTRSISHNAYISSIGYTHLDTSIPQNAVVQFNPIHPEPFWIAVDQLGIDHQTAIMTDQPWCGSELGGDPHGCLEMAAAIDAIFYGESAERARATCHRYGIQYLIARIYDPAWKDESGWVWTLKPVVSDNEFRALDCGP
jgi:hypothetical protein